MDIIPRRIEKRIVEALADTRVVTVVGPRQAGKSTLARRVAAERGGTYRTLDDAMTLRAAKDDPQGFVGRQSGLVVIDEIQRVPELILAIKLRVDDDPSPGRFLLTGSTHLLSVREVADTLAGRMELIEMWPLAQSEIHTGNSTFVDHVFDSPGPPMVESEMRRDGYLALIREGGFPEARLRQTPRRSDWFRSYAATVVERESKEVIQTDRGADILRLLRAVAARHGGLLNTASLAREVGIAERTTHRYLHLLQSVFLVTRTEPWWANLTSRLVKSPKIMIADSGLAAYLRRGADRDPTAAGALAEGFVLEEIRRQLTWSRQRAELFHYRDKNEREVDAILEAEDGRIVGVEVKLSESVGGAALDGLRHVRDALGPRFSAGVLLHAGAATHSHGDRIWSAPIASLWSA